MLGQRRIMRLFLTFYAKNLALLKPVMARSQIDRLRNFSTRSFKSPSPWISPICWLRALVRSCSPFSLFWCRLISPCRTAAVEPQVQRFNLLLMFRCWIYFNRIDLYPAFHEAHWVSIVHLLNRGFCNVTVGGSGEHDVTKIWHLVEIQMASSLYRHHHLWIDIDDCL